MEDTKKCHCEMCHKEILPGKKVDMVFNTTLGIFYSCPYCFFRHLIPISEET